MALHVVQPGIKKLFVCVRGESGVGKTYLMGQLFACPELCPILWFDADGSSETILVPAYRKRFNVPDPLPGRVVAFDSVEDFKKAVTSLRTGKFDIEGFGYPRTVVVDNLTELQQRWFEEVTSGGGSTDPRIDWARVQREMMRSLRDLRYRTNAHVFCSADERTDENTSGLNRVRIGLSPAMGGQVSRLFTVACRLDSEKGGARVLETQPEKTVVGLKDRSQTLPSKIADPTAKKIVELLLPTLTPFAMSEPQTGE